MRRGEWWVPSCHLDFIVVGHAGRLVLVVNCDVVLCRGFVIGYDAAVDGACDVLVPALPVRVHECVMNVLLKLASVFLLAVNVI
jgi:hypothetical protein